MPGHLRLLGSRQKRALTEARPPSVCDVVLKNYSPVPSFPVGGVFGGGGGKEASGQRQCWEVWQGWGVGEEQPQGGGRVGGAGRRRSLVEASERGTGRTGQQGGHNTIHEALTAAGGRWSAVVVTSQLAHIGAETSACPSS